VLSAENLSRLQHIEVLVLQLAVAKCHPPGKRSFAKSSQPEQSGVAEKSADRRYSRHPQAALSPGLDHYSRPAQVNSLAAISPRLTLARDSADILIVGTVAKIMIALLIPAYVICVMAPAVGFYHDDGIYLETAKALATGHGYRILSLPSEMAQTKYPVLYPAVLASVWKLWPEFPRNVVLLKSVSLLFTILWCWVSLIFMREFTNFGVHAWWIILFTLVSPWVVFLSGVTLADTMFAFLSMYCVLLLSRVVEARAQRPLLTVALAASIASGAFLTRSAGVALVAAAVLLLLLRRMPRGAVVFAFVCGLMCAPWLLWQAAHPGPLDFVQSYYSQLNYGPGANVFQGFTLPQALTIARLNAMHIYVSLSTVAGFPFVPAMFVISLPLWIFILIGAVRGGSPGWMPMRLWVLFYSGLLVCWAYPPYRFIVPIFPVLLMFGYEGFRLTLGKGLKVPAVRIGGMGLVLLSFACLVRQISTDSLATIRTGTAAAGDDWRATGEIMDWIRDNTAPDAVIAADLDPTIYLYTGRKAIRFFSRPYWSYYADSEASAPVTLSQFEGHLRDNKVNYIVMTPMRTWNASDRNYYHQLLSAEIRSNGRRFRLVHQLPEAGYLIYAVDMS
jgi:hypothetical protein